MSAFWRGLFTYLVTMGYAKYLRKRDTIKYHAFFMCVCKVIFGTKDRKKPAKLSKIKEQEK